MNNESWQFVLLTTTIPAIVSGIITVVGLYYKHQIDMENYRKISRDTNAAATDVKLTAVSVGEEVKEKLDNGIKTNIESNNAMLQSIADKIDANDNGSTPATKV